MTLTQLGELIGGSITDKDNMKQELIKPGSSHSRFIIGNYRMRVRTTQFYIEMNNAFMLGAGIYGTSVLGGGIPVQVIDDTFNQRFTTVGRSQITSWLKGDAADEITHIDFGFGTTPFSLSDTDITRLTSNCVAYWNFDQNPGAAPPQLTDQTSNTNDGECMGTMVAGDEIAGKLGNAWDFDGTDDAVSLSESSDFIFEDGFTCSIWFNVDTYVKSYPLYWDSGNGHKLFIEIADGTTDTIHIEGETDSVEVSGTNLFSTTGQWYHVIINLDRTGATDELEVFIDNVSVGTDSSADLGTIDFSDVAGGQGGFELGTGIYGTTTLGPTDTGLRIGSGFNGATWEYFDGQICECGIWTRSLSTAEQDCLYYSGTGRTHPFYTRGALSSVTKTDGQVILNFTMAGADYDNIEFSEFGLFTASEDGILYTRHVPSSTFSMESGYSGQVDVTINLDDITPGVGIVTIAGLNEIRDWVVGDAATSPIQTAWGSGTTALSASDTTLENEQERNAFVTSSVIGDTVTFEALLTTGEANGVTITKSGIFNNVAAGTLFCEQLFAGIIKTDSIQIYEIDRLTII